MKKIIVVGGGAAGMMAAISAADQGNEVLLIEKNEKLGKKVFITGKGRCNVTNAGDMDTLFANVISNPKFLYSAFYTFDNQSMMNFLEEAGCKLKVERGDRVFPVSDHSSDVITALSKEMKKRNVTILLNTTVSELIVRKSTQAEIDNGQQETLIEGVKILHGKTIMADRVIVATGGVSYVTTGSTGDGYKFGKATGHTLIDTAPSLVPFAIEESWCKEVMGLALKNVNVQLIDGKKEIFQGFGEMLFTHYGVSGPLIISASSFYTKKKRTNVKLYIDLKPALSHEQLDKRILREFEETKNKQFKNSINGLFPIKLLPIMIQLSEISPDKKVNEITKEERKHFVDIIKKVPLTVKGIRDYNEAIITKGGISVKNVNPSTMESKKVKGLFWAGEVLDLDALTGGFNLQIAWSTGYLAGLNSGE